MRKGSQNETEKDLLVVSARTLPSVIKVIFKVPGKKPKL